MFILFNDQFKKIDKMKTTKFESLTVSWNCTSDNELLNKIYVDDELSKNIVLRFNQALQNYLEVTNGNIDFNHAKNDRN